MEEEVLQFHSESKVYLINIEEMQIKISRIISEKISRLFDRKIIMRGDRA